MSDGSGVYEAHSPEAVVDLLRQGQGVFAIAVDRVCGRRRGRRLEGGAAVAPRGGRERVSAQPAHDELLPSDRVAFAHASERQFARLLDFYQIAWDYEPTSFDIAWDHEGHVVQRFTPDFYLPRVRPLHRDHHAEPEARHEEEPQGPPAARALPGGPLQGLLPARLPVARHEVRARRRLGLTEPSFGSHAPYTPGPWTSRRTRRPTSPRCSRSSAPTSVDALFAQIPEDVRLGRPLDLPPGGAEAGGRRRARQRSRARNRTVEDLVCFAAGGRLRPLRAGGRWAVSRAARSSPRPTRRTSRSSRRASCRRCSSSRRWSCELTGDGGRRTPPSTTARRRSPRPWR